jgi:hypothetical protein
LIGASPPELNPAMVVCWTSTPSQYLKAIRSLP